MEQPEALRLAEWADSYPESFYDSYFGDVATELRRQHAEIERLRAALTLHLRHFESQHALLLHIGAPDFVTLRNLATEALKEQQ